MRIPRIYHPGTLTVGARVELTESALRHTIHVLRLREAAPLILFNGEGGEYQASLQSVSKRQAIANIDMFRDVDNESRFYTHLAIGISKGDRMDYGIQKAVELGVNEITPLLTEHCVIQLDHKREEKRMQHWQGVIQSACEQSGRCFLPILNPPMTLPQWLDTEHSHNSLLFTPEAEQTLHCIEPVNDGFGVMIGPEGGFSDAEIKLAMESGCKTSRLGPRVLRTETAVVTAMSAIQTLWGDFQE